MNCTVKFTVKFWRKKTAHYIINEKITEFYMCVCEFFIFIQFVNLSHKDILYTQYRVYFLISNYIEMHLRCIVNVSVYFVVYLLLVYDLFHSRPNMIIIQNYVTKLFWGIHNILSDSDSHSNIPYIVHAETCGFWNKRLRHICM